MSQVWVVEVAPRPRSAYAKKLETPQAAEAIAAYLKYRLAPCQRARIKRNGKVMGRRIK